MARARNIKPGFFTNDTLAEVHPLGRLLFIALWTMADREGRLEDRPKKIKAEALPYDNANVERLLNDLQKFGFILRYKSGGAGFIQVLNFCKHQNPHIKEPTSTIPAPVEHGASTVQAPEEHGSGPASLLIPDSPSLIPDSLSPPEPGENRASDSTSPAVQMSIEARKRGIECHGQDPRLIALAERGVDVATFSAACDTARKGKDGARITVALPLRILESWTEQAEKIRANGATAPPRRTATATEKAHASVAALTGRTRKPDPMTIDADAVQVLAARLG